MTKDGTPALVRNDLDEWPLRISFISRFEMKDWIRSKTARRHLTFQLVKKRLSQRKFYLCYLYFYISKREIYMLNLIIDCNCKICDDLFIISLKVNYILVYTNI